MSNLSKEQLEELTALINARLAEFGPRMFDDLSPGIVRVAHDVIEAYWGSEEAEKRDLPYVWDIGDNPAPHDDLPLAAAPSGFPPPPKSVEKYSTNGNGHHAAVEPAAIGTGGAATIAMPRSLAMVDAAIDDQATQADNQARFEQDRLQLVAALREMAMGGYMPTQAAWNMARPVNLPLADSLIKRYGIKWTDLAAEAGLKLTLRQAKPGGSTDEPL